MPHWPAATFPFSPSLPPAPPRPSIHALDSFGRILGKAVGSCRMRPPCRRRLRTAPRRRVSCRQHGTGGHGPNVRTQQVATVSRSSEVQTAGCVTYPCADPNDETVIGSSRVGSEHIVTTRRHCWGAVCKNTDMVPVGVFATTEALDVRDRGRDREDPKSRVAR